MKSTPEHFAQCAIAYYLDVALPPSAIYFAVPNGGQRHKAVAAKLKAEGVKAGVADIIVIDRRGASVSRVIGLETKAEKGTLSKAQREFRAALAGAGGGFHVVRSIEDVAAALEAEGVKLKARPSSTPGRLYDHGEA